MNRRVIIGVLILAVVALFVAYRWSGQAPAPEVAVLTPTDTPTEAPTPPPEEPTPAAQPPGTRVNLQPPHFPKGTRKVIFTVGPTSIDYSSNDLAHWVAPVSPQGPIVLEGLRPFDIQVENGTVQIRAEVFAGRGKGSVRVSSTALDQLPAGWDANSDAKALEIVNKAKEPVLQVTYMSDYHVAINGVFAADKGQVLVADGDNVRKTDANDYISLLPIFKYPSWQNPARYAETPKRATPVMAPTPSAKGKGWLHSIFE